MKQKFTAIGLMSGSSLDGLDIAACLFEKKENKWSFQILFAETLSYDQDWMKTLSSAPNLIGKELLSLHYKYGTFTGELVNDFIIRNKLKPDLIASHGHTVFHEPKSGFSFQLGDGQAIAKTTGKTVISDFRSKDISLGGQGAPLVPVGDELLFSDYPMCLNIGGIANISFRGKGKRMAFDICPANQLLNFLSEKKGVSYDKDGNMASKGHVNQELLDICNNDPYYLIDYPKSLSNTYIWNEFFRVLDAFSISVEDKLRTVTEHIAHHIALAIERENGERILVTGGGAKNNFLIDRIQSKISSQLVLPDDKIIDYKEALVFAFLGVLRLRNEVNCYASVTGASKDASCGLINYP